ncbi:MAG: D-alanine-D-alanine ligase [uncultured bacterium]|nr:MAG: D-alanine-D-alanine ligase [uncultured bacterium]KKU25954.1 MAG: D-alanine-D-alanine ligase [Microgenomates group bacterium GW2011_GWA2_46_16]
MKLKIAVLYGGKSPEHEVSIITAVQAMASMPPEYETIPIYVSKTGEFYTGDHLKNIALYKNLPSGDSDVSIGKMLRRREAENQDKIFTRKLLSVLHLRSSELPRVDIIFPCFHGGVGEGGWIQGLAEFYGVPLVGTGLTGAALGMDKVAMKAVFDGANIQQAPYIWFYRHDWYAKQATFVKEIETHLKYPIFVKPSRGGSSIGTTCAKTKTELIRAIDLAVAMDTRIVVEEGIVSAREINISIMGNAGHDLECSVCEEVFHEGSEFLDFKDKYLTGEGSKGTASTFRTIPAKIDKSISNKIQTIGKLIFNLFDCSGLVRLDFLVKGDAVYCIEINTIPGCLSFYIWEKCGYPYPKLLDHLIHLALSKHEEVKKLQTDFASPILTNIASGGKLGSKLSTLPE